MDTTLIACEYCGQRQKDNGVCKFCGAPLKGNEENKTHDSYGSFVRWVESKSKRKNTVIERQPDFLVSDCRVIEKHFFREKEYFVCPKCGYKNSRVTEHGKMNHCDGCYQIYISYGNALYLCEKVSFPKRYDMWESL